MDATQPITPITTDPHQNELNHVAAELYKKNFELDETNKTLSLLRKIDEVILSTVTDMPQIAQQVADIVAEDGDFQAVIIFLNDKKNHSLVQLATSQTENIKKIQSQYNKSFYSQKTDFSNTTNIVVKAVKEKKAQVIHTLQELVITDFSPVEINDIEIMTGIKSCIIHPLIVRQEVIGAMVICSITSEKDLSQYQRYLITRLVEVVGIAIDNALLYQRIGEANERLKSIDKLKDEFVSLASHELRTPMTAIKSYIYLLLEQHRDVGTLTEKQKNYLENTYTSIERLIVLVNDMLNVSRIEAGRLIVTLKPTNIDQVIQEVFTEVQPTAQIKKLSLFLHPQQSPSPPVIADSDKIKQVLINLIGNSIKFTPPGGTITVSFSQKENMVDIQVSDTGKGIKPEDMQKLFKKFGMIEGNYLKTTVGQGTGLGLYISKSIIELHGGHLWATSDGEDKGSTFTFTLPIAK